MNDTTNAAQPQKTDSPVMDFRLPTELSAAVGWGASRVRFYLTMITIEAEREYMKRFADLADTPENLKKEYGILVDALAAWSTKTPTITDADGRERPIASEGTPADAVRELFRDRNAASERMVHELMIRYRNRLAPDVSFL